MSPRDMNACASCGGDDEVWDWFEPFDGINGLRICLRCWEKFAAACQQASDHRAHGLKAHVFAQLITGGGRS